MFEKGATKAPSSVRYIINRFYFTPYLKKIRSHKAPYPVRYIINDLFLHPVSLHVRTPYVRA